MNSVLIVDDDIILLEMFEKILTRFSYDVQIAQTGAEAVRLLEKKVYNLVISDVVMPEMDGNFFVNYIRNSAKKSTPVIGMTGTPDCAEKDGFDVVLAKPFSIETLIENVQEFIKPENAVTSVE